MSLFNPIEGFTEHMSSLKPINFCMYLGGLEKNDLMRTKLILFLELWSFQRFFYGLHICGASEADLIIVQSFLKRCCKRRYTSALYKLDEILRNSSPLRRERITPLRSHGSWRKYPLPSYGQHYSVLEVQERRDAISTFWKMAFYLDNV